MKENFNLPGAIQFIVPKESEGVCVIYLNLAKYVKQKIN